MAGLFESGASGGDARETFALCGEAGVQGVPAVAFLGEAGEVDVFIRSAV